jgi:hypothetical protein
VIEATGTETAETGTAATETVATETVATGTRTGAAGMIPGVAVAVATETTDVRVVSFARVCARARACVLTAFVSLPAGGGDSRDSKDGKDRGREDRGSKG